MLLLISWTSWKQQHCNCNFTFRNTEGKIRWMMRVGEHSTVFCSQKLLLLLLVVEQLKHKLCRDLLHIQAHHQNLVACSHKRPNIPAISEKYFFSL